MCTPLGCHLPTLPQLGQLSASNASAGSRHAAGCPRAGEEPGFGEFGSKWGDSGGLGELPERQGAAELPGHRGDGGGLREGRAAGARVPTRAALMRIRINSAKRGDTRACVRRLLVPPGDPAEQGRKTPG